MLGVLVMLFPAVLAVVVLTLLRQAVLPLSHLLLVQLAMVMLVVHQVSLAHILVVVAVVLEPLVEVLKVLGFQERVVLGVMVKNLQPSRLMEYLDFLQEEVAVVLTQILHLQLEVLEDQVGVVLAQGITVEVSRLPLVQLIQDQVVVVAQRTLPQAVGLVVQA